MRSLVPVAAVLLGAISAGGCTLMSGLSDLDFDGPDADTDTDTDTDADSDTDADTDTDTDADTDTDSDTDTDTDSDTDTDTDTGTGDCTAAAYQQCGADGNVHSYDSCDADEGIAVDCPDANAVCFEPDATSAECRCAGNYDLATGCTECLGNWDPGAGCAACLPGFGDVGDDDCGTCVRYVDAAATGTPDGLTWATAYTTIQGAIFSAREAVEAADAGVSYCHVWVKAGTYAPTDGAGKEATVRLQEGVHLYGGFSPTAETFALRDFAANATIINGAVFHVVTGADDAVIDGFTISGGSGVAISPSAYYPGAGMINDGVSPRVENCTFTSNNAGTIGGGMYNTGAAAPVVVGCTFDDNGSRSSGGAVAADGTSASTFTDCVFNNNTASYYGAGTGGAISASGGAQMTFEGCVFTDNSTPDSGGAFYYTSSGALLVSDSVFTGNTATGASSSADGGAVYLSGATATFERCVFSANVADDYGNNGNGGAIYSNGSTMTVESTVFNGNSAEGSGGLGGGIWASGGGFDLVNCTFYGNTTAGLTSEQGGAIYVGSTGDFDLLNSILWGNTLNAVTSECIGSGGAGYAPEYCDIEGYSGDPYDTNIVEDPLFVGGAPVDLHLQAGSPCVDEGTSVGAPDDDVEGTGRPVGDGYDMGAYEQ